MIERLITGAGTEGGETNNHNDSEAHSEPSKQSQVLWDNTRKTGESDRRHDRLSHFLIQNTNIQYHI